MIGRMSGQQGTVRIWVSGKCIEMGRKEDMPPGLAFERLTFLPCHGLGSSWHRDRLSGDSLCLPGVGMYLFSVTDWLFWPKILAVSWS